MLQLIILIGLLASAIIFIDATIRVILEFIQLITGGNNGN